MKKKHKKTQSNAHFLIFVYHSERFSILKMNLKQGHFRTFKGWMQSKLFMILSLELLIEVLVFNQRTYCTQLSHRIRTLNSHKLSMNSSSTQGRVFSINMRFLADFDNQWAKSHQSKNVFLEIARQGSASLDRLVNYARNKFQMWLLLMLSA